MHCSRRVLLRKGLSSFAIAIAAQAGLLAPRRVLGAWPKPAFESATLEDALAALGPSSTARASGAIHLRIPDIAENGAVVPVTVSSSLQGVETIAVLTQDSPSPLTASFELGASTQPYVSTRIKVGRTSPVTAAVKTKGGWATASQIVKVSAGGLPQTKMPEFPWPPPEASAFADLPRDELFPIDGSSQTLGAVASRLEAALKGAKYLERSFLAVPSGFALVTRIEKINDDGTSVDPPDRWAVDEPRDRILSFPDYIKALFTAQTGRYRVIAFIVTPEAVSQSTANVSADEADTWLKHGTNALPPELAATEYDESFNCRAFIYEFLKPGKGKAANFVKNSHHQGRTHLEQARVWQHLSLQI